MHISDLPTPRLRARAMEIANQYNSEYEDFELSEAFVWDSTTEKYNFWDFCDDGIWDKAKKLQPDLFKPMDGKPHIKLTVMELNTPINGAYTLYAMESDNGDILDGDKAYEYCLEVSPEWCTTIQEAVDALYSFKRGNN
jgi:hypothetical protein